MKDKLFQGQKLFALFDQSLISIYGFVYILLIIRPLPRVEMGYLMLVEAVRFFLTALADGSIGWAQIKYLSGGEADERGAIITTGLLMKLVLLVFVTVLIIVFRGLFADLMKSPPLEGLLLMIPLMLLAKIPHNQGRHILIAQRNYSRIFYFDLVYASSFIGLLLAGKAIIGLDRAFEVLMVFVLSGVIASLTTPLFLKGRWTFGRFDIKWAKKQYIFGRDSFINTTGSYLYQKTDQLMLGAMINPVAVAVYSIAGHFSKVFQLLNEAFNMVVLPSVSAISRNKENITREETLKIKRLYLAHSFLLQGLAVASALILFITADWVIVFLFGANYADAAPVLKILLVGLVALPFARLAGSVIVGMGRPDICARITWVTGGINLILNLILIPRSGMIGAAISSSASLIVMLIIYGVVLKNKLDTSRISA